MRPEDPRVQEFCIQVGEEVEKRLIPVSNFYSRDEEMKRVAEANSSRSEVLEYLMDYRKRIGVSVEEYMKLFSYKYPVLFPIYRELSCQVASSAAVQRSFSAHGRFLSPQRNCLGEQRVKELLQIQQNVKCIRRMGEMDKLLSFINGVH